MYTIKSGVPIPEDGRVTGHKRIYPFAEMKPGDCFDTPVGERPPRNVQLCIHGALRNQRKSRPEMRDRGFATRIMADEGVVRTWRIK